MCGPPPSVGGLRPAARDAPGGGFARPLWAARIRAACLGELSLLIGTIEYGPRRLRRGRCGPPGSARIRAARLRELTEARESRTKMVLVALAKLRQARVPTGELA